MSKYMWIGAIQQVPGRERDVERCLRATEGPAPQPGGPSLAPLPDSSQLETTW